MAQLLTDPLIRKLQANPPATGQRAPAGENGGRRRNKDARELLRILQDRVSRSHTMPVVLQLRGPIARRPWSKVFYGYGTAYDRPVAVKQFLDAKTGAISLAAATKSSAGLREAANLFDSDSSVACVELLDFFEDIAVIVTPWVDGPLLSHYMISGPEERTRHASYDAGHWLGVVHRTTAVQPRPLGVDRMLGSMEEARNDNRTTGRVRVIDRAIELLRDNVEKIGPDNSSWARSYGDFKPDNLIVSNGRLIGIEPMLAYEGPVINDIGHFLNHAVLQFYSFRGLRHIRHTENFVRSFCRGYDEAGGPAINLKQLTWRRLQGAVRLLLTHRQWNRGPMALLSSLCLERLVRQLSEELSLR